MLEVFISHNMADRVWCERLKAEAAKLGVAAYLAEHDIQAGTALASKVTTAIDRAQAVLVLLSPSGFAAPYVQQEIGYAMGRGKLVIPLVQAGIPSDRLAMLQGIEYIPFDPENPNEGLDGLRTSLSRLVEQQKRKTQEETVGLVLVCLGLLLLASRTTS